MFLTGNLSFRTSLHFQTYSDMNQRHVSPALKWPPKDRRGRDARDVSGRVEK